MQKDKESGWERQAPAGRSGQQRLAITHNLVSRSRRRVLQQLRHRRE
jgi:hypothetical protein